MPAEDDRTDLYTVPGESQRLSDVLDHLGIVSPVLVVAHSMGAFYAEGFARAFPERCSGLLLLDPSVPEPGHDDGRLPFPDSLLQAGAQFIPGWLFGFLRRLGTPQPPAAYRQLVSGADQHLHASSRQMAAFRLELSRYAGCNRLITAQRASRQQADPWRTTILAAEPRWPAPWLPRRRTALQHTADQLGARMAVIRPAPHHLMLSHPELVAEAVRDLSDASLG